MTKGYQGNIKLLMRESFSGAVLCHPDQRQLPLGCRDQEPRSFHFRSVQQGGISHGNLSHSNTHSLSLSASITYALYLSAPITHTLSQSLLLNVFLSSSGYILWCFDWQSQT